MKRLAAALLFAFLSGLPAFAQAPLSVSVTVSNSSGNVAAATATATLPAAVGKVTYICGFSITSTGSTAAAVVSPTVANVAGGTLTFSYASVAGATLANQPLVVQFSPPACLSAATPNTAIPVALPSLGAGNTNATVNAWGYQR